MLALTCVSMRPGPGPACGLIGMDELGRQSPQCGRDKEARGTSSRCKAWLSLISLLSTGCLLSTNASSMGQEAVITPAKRRVKLTLAPRHNKNPCKSGLMSPLQLFISAIMCAKWEKYSQTRFCLKIRLVIVKINSFLTVRVSTKDSLSLLLRFLWLAQFMNWPHVSIKGWLIIFLKINFKRRYFWLPA